jgi:hypothetical protein
MRSAQTRRARLVSGLALDRNPLRRASDLIEAWLRLALLAGFVPLAGLAVLGAARWVHADGARELRAQPPLRQVTAVLIDAAPPAGPMIPGSARPEARARWTAAGSVHTGVVPAAPGTPAKTPVRIWVNGAGTVSQAPLTAADVRARVVLAAVAAPVVVALGLWLTWLALRWLLDRHRLAGWAREWSLVAPPWTR